MLMIITYNNWLNSVKNILLGRNNKQIGTALLNILLNIVS